MKKQESINTVVTDEISFLNSLKQTPIFLHFQDQTFFEGYINCPLNAIQRPILAEAAFTTSMTGYQETATDPSFLGQHIIFTSSHIGNYASNDKVNQSDKIHATTLIARNFSYNKFLANTRTPLISGVDTRALTKYLSSRCKNQIMLITTTKTTPSKDLFDSKKLTCNDLEKVSIKNKIIHNAGENPIVIINYGMKKAILDKVKSFNLPLIEMPFNVSYEEVKKYNPRLVFLSNGPGDPGTYREEVEVIKKLINNKYNIRGICLGHQLIGLALGMKTIKLPFGQRGANHPVFDHINANLLITSQNHGYAICRESFNELRTKDLFCEYTSLFDGSIEGLRNKNSTIRSVQFHPEASPGPKDAQVFFSEIKEFLNGKNKEIDTSKILSVPKYQRGKLNTDIKTILLIGSGPIKIGQASEFDYSGTQALKAYKELGIKVILLNSNPATIMTDHDMSFKTYIEPITKENIKSIIERENIDGVLSTMGGQTALNICIELEEENYLSKKGVKLLGANVDTIKKTEDRDLFAKELAKLGYKAGKRYLATSFSHAKELAHSSVEFPLIIRRDFALGGKGAALAYNEDELVEILEQSDVKFPITMEKSLIGWKEVELEVMVDKDKNGVVICSIENLDPCGIHTGDSITVAPVQTISDYCYQNLRDISLTIAKHMNVVAGGANVQFAINPEDEEDIIVIEMNPRVSRSSALASKATGYPIAKISAGLAVGINLFEILNDITGVSPVSFEPTLDYVAVKIPIFPFNKFPSSSRDLGPQMRSIGEVLALGSNFNEALMKALRSTEQGLEIPKLNQLKSTPFNVDTFYIKTRLKQKRELSILCCLDALENDITLEEICDSSKITRWFIEQLNIFDQARRTIKKDPTVILNKEKLYSLKSLGFSDKYLALLTNMKQSEILDLRFANKIFPSFKAVDTCSGEFNATTPYFYSTYCLENESYKFEKVSTNQLTIAIFGSGPNRIGQGIEFDYSCVKSCNNLRKNGHKTIMLNSNPETVSTDYDSSDRLYLTPLYSEDLFDILTHEDPNHIISSFSGQTGINIRENLEAGFRSKHKHLNFLGPSLKILDLVEDRKSFDLISRQVKLDHTISMQARGHKELVNVISEIGYPVILRPNYVIGGESMYILRNLSDLEELDNIFIDADERSIVFQVENYIDNAKEYDVDLIMDQFGNSIFTICEHIEYAGVHSGDSGMITPPVDLSDENLKKMRSLSIELACKLEIIGPINFQFVVKENKVFCIEANPRGSRTLPFLSKAYKIDLAGLATDALMGKKIETITGFITDVYVVKQSTFPFDRFIKDNIFLGPKMRSTGETLGIDKNLKQALLKSYLGNYPTMRKSGKILISLSDETKSLLKRDIMSLSESGFSFMATKGTKDFINSFNIDCELVGKYDEENLNKSMTDAIKDEQLVAVFNTQGNKGVAKSHGELIRNNAITYGAPCFTRVENIKAVITALISGVTTPLRPISLQEVNCHAIGEV